MTLQTAYVISIAWLIRTYKNHNGNHTIERSDDHLRYMFFYEGEATPFFTLHVMKADGLLKEFVRFGDELRLHRVGYPVIVIGDNQYKKWDGRRVVYERIERELSLFGLFLNTDAVGLLWD